jgi:hypothetical protein
MAMNFDGPLHMIFPSNCAGISTNLSLNRMIGDSD